VAVESDEHLALAHNTFDLIINLHGAYSPSEVSRVSAQSGANFVTQQVGSNNVIGLNEALSVPIKAPVWNLNTASGQFVLYSTILIVSIAHSMQNYKGPLVSIYVNFLCSV